MSQPTLQVLQQRINKLLLEDGYQFYKVRPEEAGVFMKRQEDRNLIVLEICYHMGFTMSLQQFEQMKEQIRQHFAEEGVPTEVLTLFLTEYGKEPKELCAGDRNAWEVDVEAGRLIIYENQTGHFYGLEDKIQGVLNKRSNRKNIPYATAGIVLINVILFFVLELIGDTNSAGFMVEHGANYPELVIGDGEYYRLFTCMFLHFGVEHLANNMLILYFIGMRLEQYAGRVKFLVIYLLSGMAGSVLSLVEMMYTGDYAVSAGASGAVFGVIGALIWITIRNRGRLGDLTTRGMLIMGGLCLYYGFSTAGVDNAGHIGGILMGFVLSIVVCSRKKQNMA